MHLIRCRITAATELVTMIERAIAEGMIEASTLTAIGVGPDPHHQGLNVWSMAEWDRYPMFESRTPLATLSIRSWVEALDGPEKLKTAKAELDTVLRETLKLAGPRLAHLPKAVALFLVHDRGCTIVAFAHPRGGGTLINLMERRPNIKLYYPDVVLHEDGLTVFFPGGEVEGTSFEKSEGVVREFRFDQMKLAKKNDEGVTFRVGDELVDRDFSPGHIDTGCWPDEAHVVQALHAHFDTQPALLFDTHTFPDPLDSEAVDGWMGRYLSGDTKYPSKTVNQVADQRGVSAAVTFVDRLPHHVEGHTRARCRLAHLLAKEGRWEEAWAIAESVLGTEDEGWLYSLAPRALFELKRFEEALAQARAWEAAKPKKQSEASVVQAASLVALGRGKEAMEVAQRAVEANPRDPEPHYALALALQELDSTAALASFREARSAGDSPRGYAFSDFHLASILDWQRVLDAHEAQCTALVAEVNAVALPLSVPAIPSGEEDGTVAWCVTHREEREEHFRLDDVVMLEGNQAVLAAFKLGLGRVNFESQAIEFLGLEEDLWVRGVTAADGFAYCLAGNKILTAQLDTFTWHGAELLPIKSSYDEIHTDGNVLCCGSMHNGVHVYEIAEPGTLLLRSRFSGGMMRTMALARGHAFVGTLKTLCIFDLTTASQPRLVWARAFHDAEPHKDEFSPNRMTVLGRWLFVSPGDQDRGTWLLDIADPANPVSKGVLPYHLLTLQEDEDSILATDTKGHVLTLDAGTGLVTGVTRYSGEESHPFEGVVVYKHLGPYAAREEVAAVLEKGFEGDDPVGVLHTAKVLGRLDHEKPMGAALALLNSDPSFALAALEHLPQARVRGALDEIRAFDWHEHQLARVSNLLFELGELTPLPGLYKKAASDKELEDDSFFEISHEGPAASWVERRFTSAALARRVSAQHAASAHTEPFWPEGIAHEKTSKGWAKFMAMAFEQLEALGLVVWFVQQLTTSVDSSEHRDQPLLIPAAAQCLQNAEAYRDDAFALLDAILKVGDEGFTARELKEARRFRQWTGVHRAWEQYHAGDVAGARAEVDAQLLKMPNDADTLFIDARLSWVQDSAEACIARLDETVPRLGTHHSMSPHSARAKVYNVYGCALDHLERHEESIPWFEQAQRADPTDGMYMANLAEIHEKLGRLDLAKEWAQKSRDLGYSNAVVLRLADSA